MNKEVFCNNRKRLLEKLDDNSFCILFAGKAPKKSADEAYNFTPNRNFYYLTGVTEQKHILLIGKKQGVLIEKLFIEEPDPVMEKWVGKTISKEEAKEVSGIEDILYIGSFNGFVHNEIFSGNIECIYLDLERDSFTSRMTESEVFASDLSKKYQYIKVKNVYKDIAKLRLIKSADEINEIRRAIEVTIEGVEKMMKNVQPNMKENELEAYFDFVCKKRGATDFAFKTIVASGKNAAILHYTDNNENINEDDLILFDLGAQINYYNGDISRTIPANGKFSGRKKDVYNAVLRVNEAIISLIKPGANWGDINKKANELLAKEMIGLGLIQDEKEYTKYYWHSIGHSLGMDTHDVGERWVDLEPGMIFTVEPGLYIAEEGIGVRIEDDILVTKDGNENLTKKMIKTVDEIENFMKK